MTHNIKQHLRQLIKYPSITPHDAGCQNYLIEQLTALGFSITRYDNPPVANFFARFGTAEPLLIFAGHTDVVAVGDETQWHSPPFTLHARNGNLYGRGTADMKGSLAAMLEVARRFVANHSDGWGSLGFLITSGEEGDDFLHGTPYVMAQLQAANSLPTYCIVGEPSSQHHFGDMIKVGRRGSLTAHVRLQGKQGHVAYPHLADNPIHRFAPLLHQLSSTVWDHGNADFPPTSLQVTHIQAGGIANNIIPGELLLQFNIRYSTEQTAAALQQRIIDCFDTHQLNPLITWQQNGEPFLTAKGLLRDHSVAVIQELTQRHPELSTSGGTSDARFIAPFGVEVVEIGPVNASIHQINEHVSLADLHLLAEVYDQICIRLLQSKSA